MAITQLSPLPILRFFDTNGVPLVGGKLYSYAAGTTTPLATYTDNSGATPNTNPVVLDSTGSAQVWLSTSTYKFVLKDVSGNTLWTVDNISYINASSVINSMLANMVQGTIKGRVAGSGTGSPVDLTATQATAILNNFVGDTGSGGTAGIVPAPPAGSSAANMFLNASGSWALGSQRVRSVTSADTSTPGDSVLNLSGPSFNETLYDATATGVTGRILTITHKGTNLSQVYTLNTTLAQHINYQGVAYSGGSVSLSTHGESIQLQSNGVDWDIISHTCNTGWVSDSTANVTWYTFTISPAAGTIVSGTTYTNNSHQYISAKDVATSGTVMYCSGSGAPTSSGTLTYVSGTAGNVTFSAVTGASNPLATTSVPTFSNNTVTRNTMNWIRKGNLCTLWLNYCGTVAGPTNGSGDWIWSLPTGMAIDTSIAIPYSSASVQVSQVGVSAVTPYEWPMDQGSCNISGIAEWRARFAIPFNSFSFIAYGDYTPNLQTYTLSGFSGEPALSSVWTNNGQTFTVTSDGYPASTGAFFQGTGAPLPSGTLVGSPSNITYTSASGCGTFPSLALGSTYLPSNQIVAMNFQVTFPILGWLP